MAGEIIQFPGQGEEHLSEQENKANYSSFYIEDKLNDYYGEYIDVLFKNASPEALNNPKLFLKAVKLDYDGNALQYASESIKDNEEIVRAAVETASHSLQYASERLKSDREFVKDLVEVSYEVLEYADKALAADRDYVMEIVGVDGRALCGLPNFQKDRDVVLAAVREAGQALKYGPDFQDDKEIAIEAMKTDPSGQYVSKKLKQDKDFLQEAIKANPQVERWFKIS